eukprot:EG_transcript_15311
MELLASAFALEKTPEQLRREAEEEQQRQEVEAEKRRRREARAAGNAGRASPTEEDHGADVPPGSATAPAAPTASSSPSAGQRGAPAAGGGGRAVCPPKARIRITSPTVSPAPAARKGSVDRQPPPAATATVDDLLAQRTIEWELAQVALEGRIQQQAAEITALQGDLARAYDKVSELQAAQHDHLDPLGEAVEFQQKLDAMRADLARDRRLQQQRQQEREGQLRQEFEQERAALRAAQREELEDVRQAAGQQLREALARHRQTLAEKDRLVDDLRAQVKALQSDVARLTALQPQPAGLGNGHPHAHGRQWEKDIITDAKRASNHRYDTLGLPGSSADETDAMKVYLKNVVVNMLCEKDDAVKATLVPSLAELLGCSAAEVQFLYRCHPEWRPNAAPHP